MSTEGRKDYKWGLPVSTWLAITMSILSVAFPAGMIIQKVNAAENERIRIERKIDTTVQELKEVRKEDLENIEKQFDEMKESLGEIKRWLVRIEQKLP